MYTSVQLEGSRPLLILVSFQVMQISPLLLLTEMDIDDDLNVWENSLNRWSLSKEISQYEYVYSD